MPCTGRCLTSSRPRGGAKTSCHSHRVSTLSHGPYRELRCLQPETVVRWHRTAWRRYWTWKSRPRQPGRPRISKELQGLIARIATENPRWGAVRIQGSRPVLGGLHHEYQWARDILPPHGFLKSGRGRDELAEAPGDSTPRANDRLEGRTGDGDRRSGSDPATRDSWPPARSSLHTVAGMERAGPKPAGD